MCKTPGSFPWKSPADRLNPWAPHGRKADREAKIDRQRERETGTKSEKHTGMETITTTNTYALKVCIESCTLPPLVNGLGEMWMLCDWMRGWLFVYVPWTYNPNPLWYPVVPVQCIVTCCPSFYLFLMPLSSWVFQDLKKTGIFHHRYCCNLRYLQLFLCGMFLVLMFPPALSHAALYDFWTSSGAAFLATVKHCCSVETHLIISAPDILPKDFAVLACS